MQASFMESSFVTKSRMWIVFQGKTPMTLLKTMQLKLKMYKKCKIYHLYTIPHCVWKLLKMSNLNFWKLAFSTDFCSIKSDLSGNTVWPQALGFQKTRQNWHFNQCLSNVECDFFSDFSNTVVVQFIWKVSITVHE